MRNFFWCYYRFCSNTKKNFSWEPEKRNVQFDKITSYKRNFRNFTCVITILVKFVIHFLGLPLQIFFGVTTDDLLHLYALKKVKENAIFFKLFRYKVFVHWKLKLLNIFLVDSILIVKYTVTISCKSDVLVTLVKPHFMNTCSIQTHYYGQLPLMNARSIRTHYIFAKFNLLNAPSVFLLMRIDCTIMYY